MKDKFESKRRETCSVLLSSFMKRRVLRKLFWETRSVLLKTLNLKKLPKGARSRNCKQLTKKGDYFLPRPESKTSNCKHSRTKTFP